MSRRLSLSYLALWLALSLMASTIEVLANRARHAEAFQTDARIIHRLLSQRAVQHETVLATLALLQPSARRSEASEAQRLPAVYPQILRVEQRHATGAWANELPASLRTAEAASARLQQAVLAAVDFGAGHFWLAQAALPSSYALAIDAQAMVPWEEWPLPKQGSPVRIALQAEDQEILLSPGAIVSNTDWLGQRLSFNKIIAADSQPFNVSVSRQLDWRSLP